MKQSGTEGFTLVEVLLAGVTLAIAITALLGAFLGQITLNEHARNLSLAVHDANRVIEQIRQDNMNNCLQDAVGTPYPDVDPSNLPPAGPTPASWDAWLENEVPGKSIPNVDRNAGERIFVTCVRRGTPYPPAATDYCQTDDDVQVNAAEWYGVNIAPTGEHDPIQVTVSVCWRHRRRVIGECRWTGAALEDDDGNNGPNNFSGVIESPASITTLVTCRG